MTDAHKAAVEAAADWYQYQMSSSREDAAYFADGVITAYLAAMAAEGGVMVRDVGERLVLLGGSDWDRVDEARGWNACRAAMLGGDDPAQVTKG